MAVFVELASGNHHSVQWFYNLAESLLGGKKKENKNKFKTTLNESFIPNGKMTSLSEQVQTLQVQLFPVCTLPDRGIKHIHIQSQIHTQKHTHVNKFTYPNKKELKKNRT